MTELPTTTQAAILVEQHKPLVVGNIELPQELEVGQVLVELHCSGICGSQLGEIDGVKGHDRYLPHLMGHEGFARVVGRHVRPRLEASRRADVQDPPKASLQHLG